MKTIVLMIALSVGVSANAAETRHKRADTGSKAVACSGKTMSLSRDGQTEEDFEATFILNDGLQTWLRYRSDTGGTETKCSQSDCRLNYGAQRILARSVDGVRTELLDRTAGSYEGLVRYGDGASLHVVNTKATCVSVPIPSMSTSGRKF